MSERFNTLTREGAERIAGEIGSLPTVEGHLVVKVGDFSMELAIEGTDAFTTGAIIAAAHDAAKRVHTPMLITYDAENAR